MPKKASTVLEAYIRDLESGALRERSDLMQLMTLVAALAPGAAIGALAVLARPAMAVPSGAAVTTVVLLFASALTFPVAAMGLMAGLLRLVRGGRAGVRDVFSRLGWWFQCLVLMVVMAARLFGWGLLGFMIAVAGFLQSDGTGVPTGLAGTVLMLGLVIRAAFLYAMALPALADSPELYALEALKRSKRIMRCRKLFYFRLILPWAALTMLLWAAVGLFGWLAGITTPALGLVALLLGLYPAMRTRLITAAFYEGTRGDDYRPYYRKQVLVTPPPVEEDDLTLP